MDRSHKKETALIYLISENRMLSKTKIDVNKNKRKLSCTRCYSNDWYIVYLDSKTNLITCCDACKDNIKEIIQ